MEANTKDSPRRHIYGRRILKDHGCSCCNGHHDEDEGIKLNEVGTCSCGCGDDEDDEEESPLWTLIAGTVLF